MVASLITVSAGEAVAHVWGHFTLLGFGERFAWGLLFSAFLLPILLAVASIRNEVRARRQDR